MKTVEILEAFTGYPDGTLASERTFAIGQTPEVADAYARLLVDKGHAKLAGPRLPVLPPDPAATPAGPILPSTETVPT